MEPTTPPPAPTDSQQPEDLSMILKIVSCLPLIGAILWFINKDKNPKAAKSACTFALIGVAIIILINVLSIVLNK